MDGWLTHVVDDLGAKAGFELEEDDVCNGHIGSSCKYQPMEMFGENKKVG